MCIRVRWSGADGNGESEGQGKRAHPNRYPVLNARIVYVVGIETVDRSDARIQRSRIRTGCGPFYVPGTAVIINTGLVQTGKTIT